MIIQLNHLNILKAEGLDFKNFLINLSASNISQEFSYLFFLTRSGRYYADCFYIESLNYLIAPKEVLMRLISYFKKYDLRKRYSFEFLSSVVYYQDIHTNFQDPRIENYYFSLETTVVNAKFEQYENIKFRNKVIEFFDFGFEKSIVLEYGNLAKFISFNKGCYPGQELMSMIRSKTTNKTLDLTFSEDPKIIKIFKNLNSQVLALKYI